MTKRHLVESKLGEPINTTLSRIANDGRTIGYAASLMDVSYTTARNWAIKHEIKFKAKHPWRGKNV